ncbi:MAG: aspartate-semialdehyde dehydrogenase [Fidelibacterota bacterium]
MKVKQRFKQWIPVGILGATGSVGQKFVELLADHPWFEITALAASERSAGKRYREVVNWFQTVQLPPVQAEMVVQECVPDLPCRIVFSGLDSSVAGEVEAEFAQAGYVVISNSRNHRMDPDVPLLVPEINADHLNLVKRQSFDGGMIVTNPNCSTIGMVMALKPLLDAFGLEAVNVVTMQALSGAGYAGVSEPVHMDNVIPFISGEEEKMETEPLKILGQLNGSTVEPACVAISAQCNRVPVSDGHLESVSVKLGREVAKEDIVQVWNKFVGDPQELRLPSAPERPLQYFSEDMFPQPKLHRDLEGGMVVSVGRLRPCSLLDYKFSVLSHNTIRGAAGGAILNAELMVEKGLI